MFHSEFSSTCFVTMRGDYQGKWSVLYTENVLKFSDLMLNSSSANSAIGEGAAPLPAELIQNICFAATQRK